MMMMMMMVEVFTASDTEKERETAQQRDVARICSYYAQCAKRSRCYLALSLRK